MSKPREWLQLAPEPPDLAPGKRWHVFLSYRSLDRPWALKLYDVLRDLGYEVFMDLYVLPAGIELIRALEKNLEASASGILVWSTDTADSDWCKKEYATFESLKQQDGDFHYVVAKIDQEQLPLFARQTVWIDFSQLRGGPQGDGLLRLLFGLQGETLPPEAVTLANEMQASAHAAEHKIDAAVAAGVANQLIELASSNQPEWQASSALGCRAAEGLIRLERYEDALVLLSRLVALFPRSLRVRQLNGLALARSGDWEGAQLELEELRARGERDPETLGILARTWMDRYKESGDQRHLRRSRDLYVEASENAPSNFYVAINAATKSVLLDDLEAGHRFAEQAARIVDAQGKKEDYWATASKAEARLIQQEYSTAGELYGQAVAMAPEEIGSHKSTLSQAERLLEHLGSTDDDAAHIRRAFAHLS